MCAPSGTGDQATCCAGLSPGAAETPCDPSHALWAVCMSASMRSVLLAGTPHTLKYAARKRCIPAARCPAANAPSSHGIRPPSSAPFAAAPGSGHVQRPARQNDALPMADPSRPVQRRTRHPFNSLSEEKAIRSLRIDIVTEKNQKKWKILTGKTGVKSGDSGSRSCLGCVPMPGWAVAGQRCGEGGSTIAMGFPCVTVGGAPAS